MTDSYTSSSSLELNQEIPAKLPSTLNALTILTFIGCGVGLLYTLFSPVLNKFLLGMMDKAKSSGTELTAKQLEDMEKGKTALELMQANMVPLMIISLVGIALCLVGAIWMRKLKKDGFWIYTAGELLPLIGTFIVLGTGQFTGVASVLFAVGIPLIFIILYANQRKYLIK